MKTIGKNKLFSTGMLLAGAVSAYFILTNPVPGIGGWLAGVPAAIVTGLTALVRANDSPAAARTKTGYVRKAGFVLAGMAAVNYLAMPFGGVERYPSWTGVLLLNGIAMCWLTTPIMPPWWPYITGEITLPKWRKENASGN